MRERAVPLWSLTRAYARKSILVPENRFDLIVVGGGIHGLMIALFAADAGHRTLLLEKGKIGGATTAGWFRILHGGLRYLQDLDIRRFRQSLVDSRWFLQNFPDLVSRQSFLMPLYGQGMKRPQVFRVAFLLDRLLGPDRNRGVSEAQALRRGSILSPAEVVAAFPTVPQAHLSGGALWEELVVPDGAALIAALLARAREAGVTVLEETEATDLLVDHRTTAGIAARDERFHASYVVNASGAWSSTLARRFDPTSPPLAHPVLAFNLLIDLPHPAATGLALSPTDGKGMIFLYPSGGRLFVGTEYLPFQSDPDRIEVSEVAIRALLDRIASILPGFDADETFVAEITSGLLPASSPGSVDLLDRDVIRDHGRLGGARGLVSLWSVKYTTAPSVARRVLRQALKG